MKKITIYITTILLVVLMLQACKGGKNEPQPKPNPTPEVVIVAPTSTNQIADTDLKAIQALAESNQLKEDFVASDPSKWSTEHIAFSWKKREDGKYVVTKITQGKGNDSGVKKLVLNAEENQFTSLEVIELHLPQLSELSLANLPMLKKLDLTGSETATLTAIALGTLPSLDSLLLKDFPTLRTSHDWEREFRLSKVHNGDPYVPEIVYPKLRYIELTNTGITDLIIEGGEAPFQNLILKENKKLDYINIEEAEFEELSMKEEDFPELVTFKINKTKFKKPTDLQFSNYPKLKNLYVTKVEGVSSISFTTLPELDNATLTTLGLTQPPLLKDLPKLKSLDLSNNHISQLDISNLPELTRLTITDNDFVTTDNIKLPAKIELFSAAGNEKLTKVDLSPYKLIENVNIPGFRRGAEDIDTNQPNALSELNITGLTELYRINVRNNSLTKIVVGDTKFEKLEEIDVTHNQLTWNTLATIMKAILPAIEEGSLTSGSDLNLFPQREVELPTKVVNGVLDYSILLNAIKSVGLSHDALSVEVLLLSHTIDSQAGKVYFHATGNELLTIKLMADRYTGVPLVDAELINVSSSVPKP